MRLEEVTAAIRPRSDWEAVDLGLALVRRDFWRCFAVWWFAMTLPLAVTGWWLWDWPILWLLWFWWWKPMGSRMVLFEISRRLFGERPTWRTSMREIPRAWVRRFFHRFLIKRLSSWLPVTMAVEDLEGLRGSLYQQRCIQVTRRGSAQMVWLFVASLPAAIWFGIAIFGLLLMLMPEGQDSVWRAARESWDPSRPADIPVSVLRTLVSCVMTAMSLTDMFVMGAGFGIYLNNRSWIEGWDVELSLKRMAARLTRVASVLVFFLAIIISAHASAGSETRAAQLIREVKAAPEFKVHSVTENVPKFPEGFHIGGLQFIGACLEFLGKTAVVLVIAFLIGLIVRLFWANRCAISRKGSGAKSASPSRAREVMGMNISPESLPTDLPDVAWRLWSQNRHQEALGLLYRGAISRVMEAGWVDIQESDTEGDCVRRVDRAGAVAHPEYFRGITGVWMRQAYAGRQPEDGEMELLCRQWPFLERRGK